MPAEKKPVSLENIYKKNLEETYGEVPSAEEIYTEGMTAFGESAAAYKKVGEDLDALAAQKKAEKAATQAEQAAFDAARTAGSDRARMAGVSPGTKAAAAMLESVAAGAGAAAGGARPEPAAAAAPASRVPSARRVNDRGGVRPGRMAISPFEGNSLPFCAHSAFRSRNLRPLATIPNKVFPGCHT